MKKLVSIVLTMLMIAFMMNISVCAQEIDTEHLYESKFVETYGQDIHYDIYIYEEIYYHNDSNGNVDWCLVSAIIGGPIPANYYAVFDDMVSLLGECIPFANSYAVYDVAKQKFIDICDIYSFDEYEGLKEQIRLQNFLYPIGDADFDKELTVMDATFIQRAQAKLCDYNMEDDLTERFNIKGELSYISDFDRDGDRTVLDATGIQMKLAKIEVDT